MGGRIIMSSTPGFFLQAAVLSACLLASASASTPFGRSERARGPQGYAGINFRDVADDQLGALRLKEARGEEIILIDHDGPASKAGLREHDVIQQINGTVIEAEDQLRRILRETPPGRQVTFIISREGQQQTVAVQLANRDTIGRDAWGRHMTVPEPPPGEGPARTSTGFLGGGSAPSYVDPARKTAAQLNSSYSGALLETMGPQLAIFFGAQTGLLVREVDPDSPAAVAGLRAGDVVIRVDDQPVLSPADWMKTLHGRRGKQVAVVVLRDKREQTLTLIPDGRKRSSLDPGPLPAASPQPETFVGMVLPVLPHTR